MSIRKITMRSGEARWLFDYRDAKGKRRNKQFKSKGAATAYAQSVAYDLKRGMHVAPGDSPTIAEAGAAWIARCERDKLVMSTVRQYRQHLRDHIEPALGILKLSELTTPSVTAFVDGMLERHSRALTRKVLTSLHSIYVEAIATGRAAHNPVAGVKVKRTNAEDSEGDAIEMPTMDELRAILSAASGRWRPIIVTAMFTGMRGSELRGLKWEDVDFNAGVIHVRRRVDAWNNFGPPKSKAGKRDIPMAPVVANTLKEWRLACPKGEANPLGLVFPSPGQIVGKGDNQRTEGAGRPLSHACILKDGFAPLQVAAGIVRYEGGEARAKFGLHALRHAAAALFIQDGMTPKRVQTILGHASIKMTYDLYGYLFRSDDEDKAAMERIEARLRPVN